MPRPAIVSNVQRRGQGFAFRLLGWLEATKNQLAARRLQQACWQVCRVICRLYELTLAGFGLAGRGFVYQYAHAMRTACRGKRIDKASGLNSGNRAGFIAM